VDVDGIRIDFSVDYMGYRTHSVTARFFHRDHNLCLEDIETDLKVIARNGSVQMNR